MTAINITNYVVMIAEQNFLLVSIDQEEDYSQDARTLMESGYQIEGGRSGTRKQSPLNKGAPVKATSLRETWARFLYAINKAPHEAGLFNGL